MSRKWERMVERNRKSVNQIRKKQGKSAIDEGGGQRDPVTTIKGRSWMLPSVLVLFAVFYFISSYKIMNQNGTYWFTGFSYIGLGILMYLVRRPVIRIASNYITVRRFSGDKLIEPKDIEELTLHRDHIVIQLKEKNKKFFYTKMQHRFPMELLVSKLREFALHHKIKIKEEA